MRVLAGGNYDEPRGVGRKQLPTTMGGTLIHGRITRSGTPDRLSPPEKWCERQGHRPPRLQHRARCHVCCARHRSRSSLPDADPEATSMQETQPRFVTLAVKTAVCHSVTYFVMGALAYNLLHYAAVFKNPCSHMRPMTSPYVLFGPLCRCSAACSLRRFFIRSAGNCSGAGMDALRMAWVLIGVAFWERLQRRRDHWKDIYTRRLRSRPKHAGTWRLFPRRCSSRRLCTGINHPGKKWIGWTLGIHFRDLHCSANPQLSRAKPLDGTVPPPARRFP